MRYANLRFSENTDEIIFQGAGDWDIPEIQPEKWEPGIEWIGFNYAGKAAGRDRKGIHFFLDDYQFERVWHSWKRYAELLRQYRAVMTPDFSLYRDYPRALQIQSHYRKHFIGAYLQRMGGVKVYPTICWSDKKSYQFCFDGEPAGGTVCVSSVGVMNDSTARRLFIEGYEEMMARLKPETVIFYGERIPKECAGNIVRIKTFQEKFREAKIGDFD